MTGVRTRTPLCVTPYVLGGASRSMVQAAPTAVQVNQHADAGEGQPASKPHRVTPPRCAPSAVAHTKLARSLCDGKRKHGEQTEYSKRRRERRDRLGLETHRRVLRNRHSRRDAVPDCLRSTTDGLVGESPIGPARGVF